jgi:CBS domain-containing protein
VAAAAYLMNRVGATALVVLDGQGSGQPVGIITKADVARAMAAGEGLVAVQGSLRDASYSGDPSHVGRKVP